VAHQLGNNSNISWLWTQTRSVSFEKTRGTGAETGGDAGDASPHQTQKGVDMTLDFIENNRQI